MTDYPRIAAFNNAASFREHLTRSDIPLDFDDQVLSAPIIREPIVGGSGQISGNFTLEDASNVATLLRSGTLPGRLSLVDQQVVEPAANAGKQ